MSGIVGSLFNHRGSGVVAKLGTDGHSFNSGGAGVKAVTEAAAGGGAWERISTTTLNNDSTFELTGMTATYQIYCAVFSSIRTATTDIELRARGSKADPPSYYSNNIYDYANIGIVADESAATIVNGVNQAQFVLANHFNEAGSSSQGLNAVIYMYNQMQYYQMFKMTWLLDYDQNTGNGCSANIGTGRITTAWANELNAWQFSLSSGTFHSGKVTFLRLVIA